jgi:hypothetical protein
MINLPREDIDALLNAGEAYLTAAGYPEDTIPRARWVAAACLNAFAPILIPGSVIEIPGE